MTRREKKKQMAQKNMSKNRNRNEMSNGNALETSGNEQETVKCQEEKCQDQVTIQHLIPHFRK